MSLLWKKRHDIKRQGREFPCARAFACSETWHKLRDFAIADQLLMYRLGLGPEPQQLS